MKLIRFTDFNWAQSAIDRKSTFGCSFSLGSAMVSWLSKKQSFVALSVNFPLIFKLGLTVHARSLLITTHEYLLQYAAEYKIEK